MKHIKHSIFERIFDNSHTFLIETSTATGEPIVSVSKNVSRLLGCTSDEVENEKLLFDDYIYEEDIAQYLLESQQGSLSDDCDEVLHSVYRLIDNSGALVWVKDAAQVIRTDGKVSSIVHVITDVSNEIYAQEDLSSQTQRLVNVLHNAGFGLWEWNTQNEEIVCDDNWSRLIGFVKHIPHLRLNRFFALVHPDEVIEFRQLVEQMRDGKRDKLQKIVRIRHLSGKWRYHLINGSVSHGDVVGELLISMSHSDLTEQKENELAAIAALSTRNQFFARVSHEIRTPLHGILGMLSLVKQDMVQTKAKDKIDKIIANSEHLLYLLNDILDLAKLNEAKLKISIELVSITEVINQVERLFAFKAKEKDIAFKISLPPLQQDMVMTDKVRVTQILSNLVSNAIKYTHRGSVRIFTKIENEALVLCIQDTGIGIKNKAEVFDAYSQESGGHEQRQQSSGLGLEIVRKLSELLGIEIKLSSGNSGSLFELIMSTPMPNTLVSTAPQHTENLNKADFQNMKVLIVDDSDINREIVKELLEGIGAHCLEANDGYEAIKMIDNDKAFDLVLMDKHMPNMNGIDATEQIRLNTDLSQQPVIIALTADAFDIDSDKWFEKGVDEIVTKPFDLDILLKTIKRCLR